MRQESCVIFPVKSGVPVIGLGLILIVAGVLSLFTGNPDAFLPVTVIFILFGIFLIWLGLFR